MTNVGYYDFTADDLGIIPPTPRIYKHILDDRKFYGTEENGFEDKDESIKYDKNRMKSVMSYRDYTNHANQLACQIGDFDWRMNVFEIGMWNTIQIITKKYESRLRSEWKNKHGIIFDENGQRIKIAHDQNVVIE